MKITRILPRKLAIGWQEIHLNKIESELGYHRGMVRVLEEMFEEGNEELWRLKKK